VLICGVHDRRYSTLFSTRAWIMLQLVSPTSSGAISRDSEETSLRAYDDVRPRLLDAADRDELTAFPFASSSSRMAASASSTRSRAFAIVRCFPPAEGTGRLRRTPSRALSLRLS
jgi:hypothetical protein